MGFCWASLSCKREFAAEIVVTCVRWYLRFIFSSGWPRIVTSAAVLQPGLRRRVGLMRLLMKWQDISSESPHTQFVSPNDSLNERGTE
jgi:hypothetical protein